LQADVFVTAVLEIKLQHLDRFTVPLLPSDPKFNPNQPQATKEEVKRVTIKTYTLIFTGNELLTDPRRSTVPQWAKRVENGDTYWEPLVAMVDSHEPGKFDNLRAHGNLSYF
jgi:hypothetical protein